MSACLAWNILMIRIIWGYLTVLEMLSYLVLLLLTFRIEDQKHDEKVARCSASCAGGWQSGKAPAAVSLWQASRAPQLCSKNSKIDNFLSFSFLTHLKNIMRFSTYKNCSFLSFFLLCTQNHLITLACKGIYADSVVSSPLAPTHMACEPILCHIFLVLVFSESSF